MSLQKIVITGVNGFVGKHLVRELAAHKIEVVGVDRAPAADPAIAKPLSRYYSADLAAGWPDIAGADAVIHLAGLAAIGPSFDDPQGYINLNSAIFTHLAEYYLHRAKRPRLVVISSGTIYEPDQAMPLTEESRLGLSSPYAVSKVLVENQCTYYRRRGLDCVVVRPFNHLGPGQGPGFLVPDVVAQLKTADKITVGNLSTKRDYTDVRDIARAYRLLATAPALKHETYNACSGTSRSGNEIVTLIKAAVGKPQAEVVVDPAKVRPTDPLDIYGSAARLTADTGWQPEINFEQTLQDAVKS